MDFGRLTQKFSLPHGHSNTLLPHAKDDPNRIPKGSETTRGWYVRAVGGMGDYSLGSSKEKRVSPWSQSKWKLPRVMMSIPMVALLPVSHMARWAFTLRCWSRETNSHSVTISSASEPRLMLKRPILCAAFKFLNGKYLALGLVSPSAQAYSGRDDTSRSVPCRVRSCSHCCHNYVR